MASGRRPAAPADAGRRQHRQHFEDHPVRLDARICWNLRAPSGAWRELLVLGFGAGGLEFGAQRSRLRWFQSRLRSSSRTPSAPIAAEVVAVLFDQLQVLVFGQQLAARLSVMPGSSNDDKGFKIETRSMSRSVMSSTMPRRRRQGLGNQMWRPARPVRCGPCGRGAPWPASLRRRTSRR